MRKRIKLPRGYLSWTQYDIINNRSEDEYIRKYIRNGPDITNKEMEFG